jgi:hypothetical protein
MCGEKIHIKDLPNVVWLENPLNYEYLRKSRCICCDFEFKKTIKSLIKNIKIIGYEKPKMKGIVEYYIYWLKDYDRGMPFEKEVYGKEDSIKNNRMPAEAVIIVE